MSSVVTSRESSACFLRTIDISRACSAAAVASSEYV